MSVAQTSLGIAKEASRRCLGFRVSERLLVGRAEQSLPPREKYSRDR